MKKDIVWYEQDITREKREILLNQKPCILWFTGLSGSGKSTLANRLEKELYLRGIKTYLLDGDNVRHGLNSDLGFTEADRIENIRRIGEVSKLFIDAGLITLAAFISPFKSDRKIAQSLVNKDEFVEIFVDTSLSVCEKRDIKGLYKKAREGTIKNFTGIDSPYEKPELPSIHLKTENFTIDECINIILKYLEQHNYIKQDSSQCNE